MFMIAVGIARLAAFGRYHGFEANLSAGTHTAWGNERRKSQHLLSESTLKSRAAKFPHAL
jgi:hypothetical protein